MKTEKELLKAGYHKVEKGTPSPCDNCQSGHGSYSMTKFHGENYVRTVSCHDTCERLKEYLDRLKKED